MKTGSVTVDDLQRLSMCVGIYWKNLARQLRFDEAQVQGFQQQYKELQEKEYQMLLAWKSRLGSDATYKVLHEAFNGLGCKEKKTIEVFHKTLKCCQ